MRSASLFVCLLTIGTLGLAGLASAPSLAQNASRGAMVAAASKAFPAQNPKSQTFTGRVAQTPNGNYLLQDTSTNTTFLLDDRDMAKPFNGKNVKVTGTEDPSNKIIHVVNIVES